jgi:hypothetical protein
MNRRFRHSTPTIIALACALLFTCARLPAAGPSPAEPLRAAIQDLMATFGQRYAKGQEYLTRLDLAQTPAELDALRREALIANPLVSGQPILYVVRSQYLPDHHNTETMFQTGEICSDKFRGPGALKAIDLRLALSTSQSPIPNPQSLSPGLKSLLDLPNGVVRDPDVSFDGKRVLFSMRRDRKDDYHIYEINADGTGLRQITFGSGISDIDPIYLPDGRILFTSTREPKYCMCNRHIMGNLFTMEADGSKMQQIGHSTLHEGHASLLPDGRVIYDRWEYVDRNFGDAQGLWTVNPDGTNHAVYYGNNTGSPGAKLEARPVPGTDMVLCTFSSCHDRPWGALALLDRRQGIDGREAVVRTWPATAIKLVNQRGGYDTFGGVKPKYEDPCPLSDKYFLCSRMTGKGEEMGIYLLDVFGNEVLLHVEGAGCFDPMPLAPRTRPPVIPSRIDLSKDHGTFYVSNVYEGTGMDKVRPGSIKSLRVVRSPEKRFWTSPAWDGGTGQQAPGMAWNDFNNKEILGTVPVEADGSAYFSVPADTYVYFQLLDEKGMMVQSMRSGTIVRPGERAGCVGCHENRLAGPPFPLGEGRGEGGLGTRSDAQQPRSPAHPNLLPVANGTVAMRRAASELSPWYGARRKFGYLAEVQPVFDKHCVSCHDYGKEAGKKLNLAGDLNVCFNTSYVELRTKGYVHVVGAGPTITQLPLTWGSHASKLGKRLLEGHGKPEIDREVKLAPEGFARIVTWIDINAPYYPDYAGGAYRDNPYGRCPIDNGKLGRLQQLTRSQFGGAGMLLVSFTRPELSPCLAKLTTATPLYDEALAILRAGQEKLAKIPRPDMPGFQLTDKVEIQQQCKYESLRKP